VFEVTIRMLGGLLSGHVLLERNPGLSAGYSGQLLGMAVELADRMLPAFGTPTGLPASFINLKRVRGAWSTQPFAQINSISSRLVAAPEITETLVVPLVIPPPPCPRHLNTHQRRAPCDQATMSRALHVQAHCCWNLDCCPSSPAMTPT